MYNNKIVLIDAYSQIFRMFYGIRGNLSTADGMPTNAIYGIARLLMTMDRDYPHEFGAACFDKGKCTVRTEIAPDYKGTRSETPEDLIVQVPYIKKWFEYAGWSTLMQPGVEADDLIAAVARNNEGRMTYVLSSDKDLMQLVCDDVRQLVPGKQGTFMEYDPQGVLEKFGVRPDQVLDYLCMVGDTADNIPGVQGVGPKTAASLLTEFGSIENLLQNIDKVAKKGVREKLGNAAELLEKNNRLIRLYDDLPDGWNGINTIKRNPVQPHKLMELAQELGFRSLLKDIEAMIEAEKNPFLF